MAVLTEKNYRKIFSEASSNHKNNRVTTEMPIKLITVIISVSSITNRFLNKDNNIKRFFISIIGPYTKKPRIEPEGNLFKKLRAIKASEVEQAENTKAKSIITRSEPAALPLVMLNNS